MRITCIIPSDGREYRVRQWFAIRPATVERTENGKRYLEVRWLRWVKVVQVKTRYEAWVNARFIEW